MVNYENMNIKELEDLLVKKDGEAICELAYRCREGVKGAEKNLTRAFQLYHKGEKMNLPEAFYGLHLMYENGLGVGQNHFLAEKYNEKLPSGFRTRYLGNIPKPEPVPAPTPTPQPHVDKSSIQRMLTEGEQFRQNDKYQEAKHQAQRALNEIANAKSGSGVQVTGDGDIDVMEIDAYWLLCFTAFNEKRYTDMEKYFEKPGVMALHPWGTYLCSIAHQINNAPQSILGNDLQRMLKVKNNLNMTNEQRGDILGQIGDFFLFGLHGSEYADLDCAWSYYKEAGNCGNEYARGQAAKFKKTVTGKVKYIE